MLQVAAFISGLLFSVGLVLAQMTHPHRVIGFLDLTNWDPTLAFVMGGAVIVYGVAYRLITKREKPIAAPRFAVPTNRKIDRKLVVGSVIFGVGWGMGGFCPGPGLVSVTSGTSAIAFVGAMLGGMYIHTLYSQWSERRALAAKNKNTETVGSPVSQN